MTETSGSEKIHVEVAYARPERQEIIGLNVDKGCTALEAVKRSGICSHFPEIDPDSANMGIFSKGLDGKVLPTPDAYVLEANDRVEIYRPLLADPKAARKARAAKAAKGAGGKKDGADSAGNKTGDTADKPA